MVRKIFTISIILMLAVAFVLLAGGCAEKDGAKIVTDKQEEASDEAAPTRGLEFDENGEPTPESAEQILQEQLEQEYQEYLDKEHEKIMEEYYLSQPETDTDPGLPAGH